MSDIPANLAHIQQRLEAACGRVQRSPDSVELIAVSKTFPVDGVRFAVQAGQKVFGESRLQEAEAKIEALSSSLSWHFIGRVQRNKVRKILPLFDVIHAIDSLRLAQYTDEIARELGLFPKVFLQINLGGEMTKGGFEPESIHADIEAILALERLELMGLMCIPPPESDPEGSRKWFVALRNLRDELEKATGTPIPGLSMGMSGDFEVAIEEGATHVRVGSSIFGNRSYRVDGELG